MLNAKLTKTAVIGLSSAIALSAFVSPARATNLVQNGGFEITTGSVTSGELGFNISATGWTSARPNAALNLIIGPGVADNAGVTTRFGANNFNLWGPGPGGGNINNGLPATSPVGGNYLAADGDSDFRGALSLSQPISGLIPGQRYQVSFWEAAAQQRRFRGPTTERWEVTFGTQTLSGTQFNNPDQGFQAWRQTFLTFTATAATQTLSFLAIGTPNGQPPFSLLDGVSVILVPEPSSVVGLGALVTLGFGIGLKSRLMNRRK